MDNIPYVATLIRHEIQIAKPGESFGPTCRNCMQRGHWTNQCHRQKKCKLCGDRNHKARDCPFESSIATTDEEPDDRDRAQYKRDYPKLPQNQKKSTPKGSMPDKSTPDDLSQEIHQIEVQQEKQIQDLNKNIEVEEPTPLELNSSILAPTSPRTSNKSFEAANKSPQAASKSLSESTQTMDVDSSNKNPNSLSASSSYATPLTQRRRLPSIPTDRPTSHRNAPSTPHPNKQALPVSRVVSFHSGDSLPPLEESSITSTSDSEDGFDSDSLQKEEEEKEEDGKEEDEKEEDQGEPLLVEKENSGLDLANLFKPNSTKTNTKRSNSSSGEKPRKKKKPTQHK
uniref:ZF(CCHC)-6 zinc finger protein n=1 Tax=Phallusia mammillata TaxID=59560 RepID=A0A6F9DXJ5_9ASCI|nr:ZF(CCHC)-6 zinc finger protein [Phallusia mammillata]